jgi:hypothetical protein
MCVRMAEQLQIVGASCFCAEASLIFGERTGMGRTKGVAVPVKGGLETSR